MPTSPTPFIKKMPVPVLTLISVRLKYPVKKTPEMSGSEKPLRSGLNTILQLALRPERHFRYFYTWRNLFADCRGLIQIKMTEQIHETHASN